VTIFQDDVRIATNVLNSTARGRSRRARRPRWQTKCSAAGIPGAAAPLSSTTGTSPLHADEGHQGQDDRDAVRGDTRSPYTDSLWRSLFIFLGMTVLG